MTPASREEIYLAKLCGENWELPYPASRLEYYYAKLCGMNVPLPAEPLSRPELYLAYLCGMDVKLSKPVSRKEMYMAKACGMPVGDLPKPISRSEQYWVRITEPKEFTGTLPMTFTSSKGYLIDFRVYGNISQINTNNEIHISENNFCGLIDGENFTLPIYCRSPFNIETPVVNICIGSEPLRKIGEIADYIDFHNQQIVRKIFKYQLTGQEFWTLYNGNYFSTILDQIATKGQGTLYASHFPPNTFSYNTGVAALKAVSMNLGNYATNIDEWKSYLATQYKEGTPVTIWCILSQPVVASLQIPPVPTYFGTTTIHCNSDVLPSQMYIKC
jgi:hypothetical protein